MSTKSERIDFDALAEQVMAEHLKDICTLRMDGNREAAVKSGACNECRDLSCPEHPATNGC
ncbi:hypothetical protein ACFLZH_03740 [Patescibacteria group bacterium]